MKYFLSWVDWVPRRTRCGSKVNASSMQRKSGAVTLSQRFFAVFCSLSLAISGLYEIGRDEITDLSDGRYGGQRGLDKS